jgi:hypothetical protein
VEQISKNGQTVATYNFVGVFPSNVSEIALEQGSTEPEKFTVSLSYDYFVIGIGTLNVDSAANDRAGTQPTASRN